jgi:hypothetical protein
MTDGKDDDFAHALTCKTSDRVTASRHDANFGALLQPAPAAAAAWSRCLAGHPMVGAAFDAQAPDALIADTKKCMVPMAGSPLLKTSTTI